MALTEPTDPTEPTEPVGGGGMSRLAARGVLAIGALLVTVGIAVLILFGFSSASWYLLVLWGLLLLIVYGFLEPETVRAFFGQGQLRAGARAMLMTVLVLAAIVLVNVVVKDRLGSVQLDISKGSVNSLAPQTEQVLKQLDQPLTATLWYAQSASEVDSGYQLLQRYRDLNHRITLQRFSSTDRPDLFHSQGASTPSVVLQVGSKQPKVVTDMSEQGLTTALIELVSGRTVKVYFLTGHGEGPLDTTSSNSESFSSLKQALQSQGITALTLNLGSGSSGSIGSLNPSASPSAAPSPAASASPAPSVQVPSDADALVLLDPQLALSDAEVAAISTYLDHGGRLLLSNLRFSKTNIGKLVSKYQVKFGNGVVLDQQLQYSQSSSAAVLAITSYGSGPITQAVKDEPSIMDVMGSVGGSGSGSFTVSPVVSTKSDACERTDSSNPSGDCAASDTKGPFNLIVSIEQSTTSSRPTRIVAMGGADWMSDATLSAVSQRGVRGNNDLAVSIVNWLVGQEKIISIPPRQASPSTVFLTDAQRALVFPGFFLFAPALIGFLGFWVWLRNRD